MSNRRSRCLAENVHLKCFMCLRNQASHVLNFDWDEMNVQFCLCSECVSLREEILVANLLY